MPSAPLPVPRCEHCPTRIQGIFGVLPRERVRDLDQCKADNLYQRGQVVFYEGNPSLGVHCLFQGQVKLYKAGSQGRPQIVGIARPGTLIGHRALLAEKPHTFTAEALNEARLCFVGKDAFFRFLSDVPAVAQALLRRMSLDLDAAEDRIMDVVEQPVPVRMARLLLTLGDSYGQPGRKGTEITLHLTREEMAEIVGTTQETTIRVLSQFKRKGLVRLDRRSIAVLDPAGLSKLAA